MTSDPTQKIRLMSAKTLAALLSVSQRQVFRLKSAGRLPAPLRIGGSVRWSEQEVNDWLAAGAPDMKTWEARKSGHG